MTKEKTTPKKKTVLKKKVSAGKADAEKKSTAPKKSAPVKETTKAAEVGHNSGISSKQLKQFVKKVEDLENEKKEIADDIKDIFAHAKSSGFNVKIMRKVLKLRKQDKIARDEEAELVDTYMFALGDR